jgi:hypothetical protein
MDATATFCHACSKLCLKTHMKKFVDWQAPLTWKYECHQCITRFYLEKQQRKIKAANCQDCSKD